MKETTFMVVIGDWKEVVATAMTKEKNSETFRGRKESLVFIEYVDKKKASWKDLSTPEKKELESLIKEELGNVVIFQCKA